MDELGFTIALAIALGVLSSDRVKAPFYAVLSTAVYAGAMGGAVSFNRRLGAVPTHGDALGSIHALTNSGYVLVFAPLTGAVFAVITMLLFIGGILSGAIFPAFVFDDAAAKAAAAAGHTWVFVHALLPKNVVD